MSVTVHLAARMVRDRAHLDRLLATMARGGDRRRLRHRRRRDAPARPVRVGGESSSPIVHEHPDRPRTIGIAGYPEGHPLIDSADARERPRSRRAPIADYVTTQLCFDADAMLAWIRGRDARDRLPVLAGVPGIVDRRRAARDLGEGRRRPVALVPAQAARPAEPLRLSGGSADQLYDALAPSTPSRARRIPLLHVQPARSTRGRGSAGSKREITHERFRADEGGHEDGSHEPRREDRRRPAAPVELARNSQIGPYVYPKVAGRVHELARRAGRLARDVRALRPVAPHDRPLHRGAGRDPAALRRSASTRSRTSR